MFEAQSPAHGPRQVAGEGQTQSQAASARAALGGSLGAALEGLEHPLGIRDKVSRVQANRSGQSRRHLRRLNHSLCPRGQAQELVLGAFPFVARYGREWIDELLEELDPLAAEHLSVDLGPSLLSSR